MYFSEHAADVPTDVVEHLLPAGETIVLPRVGRIGGGLAYRIAKRAADVAVSACGLVVLAVPMAAVAVAVRLDSPGPAIYRQVRVGKGGRPFAICKFRTMRWDAEAAGARWADADDERATRVGRVLRRHHLDELPQLWNVLKGDMSLVGPRPERPAFCELFEERLQGWGQRTLVRPGITGLAQVVGGSAMLPADKVLLDLEYIERRGAVLDLSLALRTLGAVARGDGGR